MWKIFIFSSIFAIACAGIIHDHPEPLEAETDHQLKVSHEHATSHQSFKLHHYHPVPVYIKDHHLLKSPIEVGGLKHIHKILHPKDEPHHGHGLTLESHTEEKDHTLGAYEYGGAESNQNYRTIEPSGLSAPAQFQERRGNTGPATFN